MSADSIAATTADNSVSPKVISVQFRDVEEAALHVPERTVYSQLTRGPLEGVLHSYIISPQSSFSVAKTNRSIRKQFEVGADHLRMGFHWDHTGRAKCCANGMRLEQHEASANLPGTPIDLHFGENHEGCWISLDYQPVLRLLTWQEEEASVLREPGRLVASGCTRHLLHSVIAAGRIELFGPGSRAPQTSLISAFEKGLFAFAAYALSSALGRNIDLGRASATHRGRLLRKACDVIDAKASEGLTISALCLSVGASRRSLETIFVEGLNVSPYQYVLAVRFNAIRKALLSEEHAGCSIGDIVSRWGIWHLSRFAEDYRKMFGELPSQTRTSALRK